MNGSQVKKVIKDLEAQTEKYSKNLERASQIGDKAGMKKWQKAINDNNRLLRQMQTETATVTKTLARLDQATPKELNKALRTLNSQLNNMQRGTKAWDEQVEKIRRVRAEIDRVNNSVRETNTGWGRFKGTIGKWGGAIAGAIAAVTELVTVGRKAVDDFAAMDQEMANVRKFTGMSAEQVTDLNEELKKIDTRSSRESLNKLAQEAGRLGKTSQEDVLGFVKAADKINVALDDLGEGATLTLSKLTGIFGDEQRLGTEKALLSVGSVINELSQNCSASAPYLAEFASRMGGVGAQAGMTVSQIMAFASVLDANNQKVEASSTALQQVIVRLYQDPAKYAKVAGMDVANFAKLVKTDMNAALLEFLSTLKNAGNMDVLSPMFKDMGENGSRAVSALATLANNIDFVKSQQMEANKAFAEATSIDNEFNVQNETVQASLEKAKNRMPELSVELGEKLQPAMRFAISSTSALIEVLRNMLNFVSRNKTALLNTVTALTVATIAYYGATGYATIKTKAHAAAIVIKNAAMVAARVATLAESAALALLSGNLTRARAAMKLLNATMKTNPIGLVAAAVGALIVAIVALTKHTETYTEKAQKLIKKSTEVSEATIKEQRELDKLFGVLQGAKKGTEQYNSAKKQLMSQYGRYLSGLIDEKGEIINLSKAYETLSAAIARANQMRGIQSARDELDKDYFSSQQKEIKHLQTSLESFGASVTEASKIATKVAQAMASGKQVDAETRARIAELSKNTPTLDTATGQKLNKVQRSMWKLPYHNGFESVTPEKIYSGLRSTYGDYRQASKTVDAMERGINPTKDITDTRLLKVLEDIDGQIASGKGGKINVPTLFMPKDAGGKLTSKDLQAIKSAVENELRLRGVPFGDNASVSNGIDSADDSDSGSGYVSSKEAEKERKKQEREARAAAVKARKEFKESLKAIDAEKRTAEAEAIALRGAGAVDYLEYLAMMHDAEVKYFDESMKLYEKNNLQEDVDYAELLKKKEESENRFNQKRFAVNKEAIERMAKVEEQEVQALYKKKSDKTLADELELQERLLKIRYNALADVQQLYAKDSEEWMKYQQKIDDLIREDYYSKQEKLAAKAREYQNKFDDLSVSERYALERSMIDKLYEYKYISEDKYREYIEKLDDEYAKKLPGAKHENNFTRAKKAQKDYGKESKELKAAFDSGMIDEKEFKIRMSRIKSTLTESLVSPLKSLKSEWASMLFSMIDSWKQFGDALSDPDADPFEKMSSAISSTAAIITSAMQMVTQFTEAELSIQSKAVEKRYDREISLAEGNTYLTKKLEKEKEEEIARLKEEASKKEFTMQVIATIAQTAANAVQAYGAGLSVGGPVGLALGPIAAALATAQGLVQVAILKKQQQAAAASGYMEGGFTRKGRRDEPAGIVHAGEWVASQKLVNSPRVRPIIDALEYVQRNNTVGTISMEDVSRTISAPSVLAYAAPAPASSGKAFAQPVVSSREDSGLKDVLSRLNDRLNEPFVTENYVTGPRGMKKAQEEYNVLIRNKSRKIR